MATLIQLCWKFPAVERSWYVQVIALLSGISMKPPNLFSPPKKILHLSTTPLYN
jgi:hypothetical protein